MGLRLNPFRLISHKAYLREGEPGAMIAPMKMPERSALTFAVLAIAMCAGLVLLPALVSRFFYEWSGPLTGDSSLYLAVGRGMLVGLSPYADLFESKPPGIFLLSAASVWLFDSPFLGSALAGLSLLIYPLVFWFVAPVALLPRLLLALLAALWGLFAAVYAGEFQVELYGALCASIYVAVIARPAPLARWQVVLAGASVLGAIGMKEPFFLTCVAAALVLWAHDAGQVRGRLLWPLVLAAAVGLLLLALLGLLVPYFTLYVSQMVGAQGLGVAGLAKLTSLAGVLDVLRIVRVGVSQFSPMTLSLIGALVVLSAWRGSRLQVLAILGATILSLVAIALSGYFWPQYYVFAVPFVLGLSVLAVRQHNVAGLSILALALLAVTLTFAYKTDYTQRQQWQQAEVSKAMQMGRTLDQLMDACGYQRYLFLGTNGIKPYAYMKHAPLGPIFVQYPHYLAPERSYWREAMMAMVQTAPVVLVRSTHTLGAMERPVVQALEQHFTAQPPACAADAVAQKGYKLLYRLGNEPH